MFVDFDRTKGASEKNDFFDKCTKHFLSLGDDFAPTLHFPTKNGAISIFVFEQNAAVLGFFSDILVDDRPRFRRMAEAFARAHLI